MYIKQYFVKGLSNMSYILGGDTHCAVIDPKRDIGEFIEEAKSMGYEITHIIETHLHADFISGHMDLAEKTGAKIVAPKSANCDFDHLPVSEGDEFQIDHLKIKVIETPGHTPEHVNYIVTDTKRGEDPCAIFTGDTLFVGDVGRPDLFPGRAEELSRKLFDSLNKIMSLPDHVEVYPAHGAGSLCGKAMSAKRSSTIGYERKYNPSLVLDDYEKFKGRLLSGMPSAPDHFSRCSEINRKGPAIVERLPNVEALEPMDFKKEMEKGALVLDAREPAGFGGQHIENSIHIDIDSNFAVFSGWILPPDQPLLLVCGCEGHLCRAIIGLHSVGLDRITGWLEGGIYKWAVEGLPVKTLPQADVHKVHSNYRDQQVTVLDVRSEKEYESKHIEGARNVPAPDTRGLNKVEGDPVYVMCSSGHRSSMASSILMRNGVKNVVNVPGSMAAWAKAGYSETCPECNNPHGPRPMDKEKNLSRV